MTCLVVPVSHGHRLLRNCTEQSMKMKQNPFEQDNPQKKGRMALQQQTKKCLKIVSFQQNVFRLGLVAGVGTMSIKACLQTTGHGRDQSVKGGLGNGIPLLYQGIFQRLKCVGTHRKTCNASP